MFAPLTIRAPAKLNLHLRIFPKANAWFHPLRSWFRTIEMFDELTLTRLEEAPQEPDRGFDWTVDLHTHRPDLPSERNLVRWAWVECATACDDGRPLFARIDLKKRIPIGGGLGGGSSDAAATIDGYSALRRSLGLVPLDGDARAVVAEMLGSDVPFFVRARSHGITDATCTGRGEVVEPFDPARRHAALVLLTMIECPTPAIYQRFDELAAPRDDGEPDFEAWSGLAAADLLPLLRNDLEPAAFALRPDLAQLRGEAERRLGRRVRMTGSGGTLFTLFDDAAEAEDAKDALRGWTGVRPVVA